jgi:hypothetical protein
VAHWPTLDLARGGGSCHPLPFLQATPMGWGWLLVGSHPFGKPPPARSGATTPLFFFLFNFFFKKIIFLVFSVYTFFFLRVTHVILLVLI